MARLPQGRQNQSMDMEKFTRRLAFPCVPSRSASVIMSHFELNPLS